MSDERDNNVVSIRPHQTFHYSEEFLKVLRNLFPGFEDMEILLEVSPRAIGSSILSAINDVQASLTLEKLSELLNTPEGVIQLKSDVTWCLAARNLYRKWSMEITAFDRPRK